MGFSFGSFHGGSKPDYSTNDNSTSFKANSDNVQTTDSHDVDAQNYSAASTKVDAAGGTVTIATQDKDVLGVLRDTIGAALSNTREGAASTYAQTAQLAQASAGQALDFKKWALIGGAALVLLLGGAYVLTRKR